VDIQEYQYFVRENPGFLPACIAVLMELRECGVNSHSATKVLTLAEFRLLRAGGIIRNGIAARAVPHEFAPFVIADIEERSSNLAEIMRPKSHAGFRGRESDRVKAKAGGA
jgi:hypothetical protein